jgi:hypothetical protein
MKYQNFAGRNGIILRRGDNTSCEQSLQSRSADGRTFITAASMSRMVLLAIVAARDIAPFFAIRDGDLPSIVVVPWMATTPSPWRRPLAHQSLRLRRGHTLCRHLSWYRRTDSQSGLSHPDQLFVLPGDTSEVDGPGWSLFRPGPYRSIRTRLRVSPWMTMRMHFLPPLRASTSRRPVNYPRSASTSIGRSAVLRPGKMCFLASIPAAVRQVDALFRYLHGVARPVFLPFPPQRFAAVGYQGNQYIRDRSGCAPLLSDWGRQYRNYDPA